MVSNRSLCRPKGVEGLPEEAVKQDRALFAFQEKIQTVSASSKNPVVMLGNVTRLDPITYALFGAYRIEAEETTLLCDDWLPLEGDRRTLDNLQSHEAMLRRRLEFTCMHLIGNAPTRTRQVSMMFAEAVCTVRNHPIMVIVLR